MKTFHSLVTFLGFTILFSGCNKSVTTGVTLDLSDKLMDKYVEDEVLSLHFMSGCYTGKICKNNTEDINQMRVVLQEDSTYDWYCETLYGNKKSERLRGSYSFSHDTLTLYTAQHNQKFIIKDDELIFISYNVQAGNEMVDDSNILYKN